jgi:hypothetical protein
MAAKNLNYYYTHRILPNYHLIITSHEGSMSIGQYMESALEFMSDPLFIKNMNMLVDFRDCYSASFHMEL